MKKIAFMFAAAAMFVACGEGTKEIALSAQDSLDVQNAVEAAIAAELGEAPVAPVAEEGQEVAAEALAAFKTADSIFNAKKDSLAATKEAKIAEALAKKLEDLTKAAAGEEKPAE